MHEQSLEDILTIVTVTHFSPREEYGELAPPSAGIVKTTAQSIYKNLSGTEKCKHILIYNEPKLESTDQIDSDAKKYHSSLVSLSEEIQLDLHVRPNDGLRGALLHAIDHIETPLTLFVEHDWEFIRNIDVDTIIAAFDKYSEINSIRFNKRPNQESLWDTIVEEDCSKSLQLCRTSAVGNHPQIIRTSVFEDWVIESEPTFPMMIRGFWYHYSTPQSIINYTKSIIKKYLLRDDVVNKFDDVEFVLDTKYKKQIREDGFEDAHSDWGIYIYGSKRESAYVQHLGR